MFIAIYRKVDSAIVNSRNDSSVPASSAQHWLEVFASDNNVDVNDYAVVEIEKPSFPLEHEKHMFVVETNTIGLNPNYVAPPRVSDSVIPTTDSSTGETVDG